MIGSDHKLEILRHVPLLSGCSDPDLRAIASAADLVDVEAGDVLRAECSTHRSFFLILGGTAALGTEALLGPGSSDGAIGLLGGEPDTDELRMLSDGRVLVAGQRQFAALINGAPGFAKAIAEDLSRRLREQHRADHGRPIDVE